MQGERPADLTASVDLTAYRVVQEALTEARSTAAPAGPGRHHATARSTSRSRIVDDGARVSERRLLGLRERVHLYGGEVERGAQPSGGHAVQARLPLEGVPA